MIRFLVEGLGADYAQWRALTLVALKLDMRVASLGHSGSRPTSGRQGLHSWMMRLLLFTLMGCVLCPIVLSLPDVFMSGTFFLTYSMMMVSVLVLLDFGAVVVSPDDFGVLGYQPIDSRTYFLSRLTNALIFGWAVTLAVGAGALTCYFFADGWNPLLGLAAIVATFAASTAVVLALLLLYTAILKFVRPDKLRRALSYLQFLLSFLIYGGYSFLPRFLNTESLSTLSLEKSPVIFLLPPTWFASLIALARKPGMWSPIDWLPALGALAVVAALFALARGRLSLDYSQRLADASESSEPVASSKPARGDGSSRRRFSFLYGNGEERAVALLASRQFKYDNRFRMAVLAFIPATLLTLYMAMEEGRPPDPFTSGAGMGDAWVLYLIALMIPVMVKKSFASSDAFEASWIFLATPADLSRLILSVKKILLTAFVLPYLVFLGFILAWLFGNPLHAFLQIVLIGLLARLILQFMTAVDPELPFSQPVRTGERGTFFLVVTLPIMIIGGGTLYAAQRWFYPHPPLHALLLASLVGLGWAAEKVVRMRVRLASEGRTGTEV